MPPPPELILAIETSNPTAHPGAPGVALGRLGPKGTEILGEEPVSLQTRLDDDLMPAIDRLVRRHRASPSDLAAIAVSVGPGGYTSVRIGVSAARAIARVTGAKTYSIPTALVAAIAASREVPPGTPLAVCLAWKNDEVWCHRFEAGDPVRALDEGSLVQGSAIAITDTLVMEHAFAERLAPGRANQALERVLPVRVSASDVIRACERMAAIEPEALVPFYPREPEAVTKWRLRAISVRNG